MSKNMDTYLVKRSSIQDMSNYIDTPNAYIAAPMTLPSMV